MNLKTLEGFILIVVGFLTIFFHILKFVPESDAVLTFDLTFFDFLQMSAKLAVIILIGLYYKSFIKEFSVFYSQTLLCYPETKSDLTFVITIINFFELLLIYELTVPEMKCLLIKTNREIYSTVGVIEVIFVILGVVFLIRIWRALQVYLGDIVAEKNRMPANEDSQTKIEPKSSEL